MLELILASKSAKTSPSTFSLYDDLPFEANSLALSINALE